MGDHQYAARELGERILERAQCLDVEIVRGLVKEKHVPPAQQRRRKVQAPALAAGERAYILLLVGALEVEAAEVSARGHFEAADHEYVLASGDRLPRGLVIG